MSYGILRIEKYTAGSVKGLENHDKRLKQCNSNPDINNDISCYNYDLQGNSSQSYQQAISSRIKELQLRKAVRKDAIVMAQCLVTSDKDFFDRINRSQQEMFFKKSLEFVKERYGEKNIISATVHLDEKTPHIHINFIPVTNDNRLSAKSLLNKVDFQSLQDDFYKKVCQYFGLERGVKGSIAQHLAMPRFKKVTLERDIELLNNEKQELKDGIKALEETPIIKNLQPLVEVLSNAKVTKKLFAENKVTVKESQFELLKQSAVNFISKNKESEYLKKENTQLAKRNQELFKSNERLVMEKMQLDGNFRAKSNQVNQLVSIIDEIVKAHPEASKIVEKHSQIIQDKKKLQNVDLDR